MRLRRMVAAAMLAGLFVSAVVLAQAPQRVLQPGAEVKRLDIFVGNKTSEGTMTLGTVRGTFTAHDRATWIAGGFFVENHSEFTTPFGPGTLVEIMGYDSTRRVYTHDSFSSAGRHISSTGTVEGDTWRWVGTDGRSRHTVHVLTSTTSRFTTEISQDGTTWTVLSEGTTTKGN